MKKHIALFGGAFDPPHYGHLFAIKYVVENALFLDQLLLVPVFSHPWRTCIATPQQRLSMIKLLIKNTEKIKVDQIEIESKKKSYTIDTIEQFTHNSKDQYYIVVGSDALPRLTLWHRYNDLIKQARFIIIPRVGYPPRLLPNNALILPKPKHPIPRISSSLIRKKIKNHQSLEGLVPQPIIQYITRHNLYV